MNKAKDLWVIIPANDEEKRITDVLKGVKRYTKNIIVVDDGSSDNTFGVSKKQGVIVLQHVINLGKGAAVKTGCDFALKKGAKRLLLMDSDGQHDPEEIPNFSDAMEKTDIVFGYRKFNKNMPFIFKLGNRVITAAIWLLYGIRLRDTQCGYRALTAEAYKKLRWKSNDYSMESEMIANMGMAHLRYKEIPIQTIYSERYKGTTVLDGVKIVLNMIFWRLKK